MKRAIIVLGILAVTSSYAGLYVNVGRSTLSGIGPTGADANYLQYISTHENATAGALVTFNGISFPEGRLPGAYDVGVAFTWPDANGVNSNLTKQAFQRADNGGYGNFWRNWVGVHTSTANGGIGGGDRLRLHLTGLAADQDYIFTSYHFDTADQAGSFTVDQTTNASETATSPFPFPRANGVAGFTPWIDNAYTFDVTTDGSGNLNITYAQNSGGWIAINGFDLVAPPPPNATIIAVQ